MDADIPYLLLTPGPLTTSRTVKQVMLRDYCTWDDDYNSLVTEIRARLVRLASKTEDYTCILMQGSGTFCVEAAVGSVIPPDGKLLVINNGAYGQRIIQMAQRLRIAHHELLHEETEPADLSRIDAVLRSDPAITHVALVHCETTTGLLNPAAEVGQLVRRHGRLYIVDAMSSFAGIPMTAEGLGAHYLVSSSNKCVQGVPGFGFVFADRAEFAKTRGYARSLAMDLYDQWHEMETKGGKWRYTSPTHVVRAFYQAMDELDAEGGITARNRRYRENHRLLVEGMTRLGFQTLLPAELQSPIITSFLYPSHQAFSFEKMYAAMKRRRFVIYPGKISRAATFRIGTIGHVFPADIELLLTAMAESLDELGVEMGEPAAIR